MQFSGNFFGLCLPQTDNLVDSIGGLGKARAQCLKMPFFAEC